MKMLSCCWQQVRLEGDRAGPLCACRCKGALLGVINKNKARWDMGELLHVLPRLRH